MSDSLQHPASFRDPSGFLFERDGVLYRQVAASYQEEYELLMDSGLYRDLVEASLLIAHEEVDLDPPAGQSAFKILRPERVRFISYPYEWAFSQLKDAALATLQIQRRALDFGMTLRDASAYNIQFHQGQPLLIDSLSFGRYEEGEPWVAYRQFCQHFLAPLALMAYRDVRLGQLSRIYIDGPPLDLASGLLPFKTRFSFSLLSHIHLHAKAQQRFADRAETAGPSKARVSRTAYEGLIANLRACVEGLEWQPGPSEWVSYYEEGHRYTDDAQEHKRELVGAMIEHLQPGSVWDLGANTGLFSRIASERGIPTLAFDIDPGAVERNYRECRAKKETHILPLVQDLTNPSPGLGWAHRERMAFIERAPTDTVLALALIHHLAISNNVPLPHLAQFFASVCQSLIIEFVPKVDSQVRRLLASREDIFPDYTREGFEAAFSQCFAIEASEPIRGSER
ncbi:MAG: SAM-dependent methyltransferase, partial [Acidobacteriota bacterium]